jgi:hypothetical protein
MFALSALSCARLTRRVMYFVFVFADQCTQQMSADVKRYFAIGKSAIHARDWRKAVDAFSKVIELDPKSIDGWQERSFARERLEDFDAGKGSGFTLISL